MLHILYKPSTPTPKAMSNSRIDPLAITSLLRCRGLKCLPCQSISPVKSQGAFQCQEYQQSPWSLHPSWPSLDYILQARGGDRIKVVHDVQEGF